LKKGSGGRSNLGRRRVSYNFCGIKEHIRTISYEPFTRYTQPKGFPNNRKIEQRRTKVNTCRPFMYLSKLTDTTKRYTTISKSEDRTQKLHLTSKTNTRDLRVKLERLEMDVHTLESTVTILRVKKMMLKRSNSLQAILNDYKKLCNQINTLYTDYSSLSKSVVEMKKKEKEVFEEYVEMCQQKETIKTNIDLEASHKQTKMKLLEETLRKRNNEYTKALQECNDLVLLL